MTEPGQALWSEPVVSLDHFYDLETRVRQLFDNFPRPEGRLHAVLGGVKMGKSSLLNVLPSWLQQEPARHGQRLAPVLIRYSTDQEDLQSPHTFLLRVVRGLREGLRSLGLCTISERDFEPYFEDRSAADGFRDALVFLLEQARQASSIEGGSLGEIRLLGLIDDAEDVANRPWSDNLFFELRKLFQAEALVRRQLDIVMAGGNQLASYFRADALWSHGGRLLLYPMAPSAVETWLQDASEGLASTSLARAVVAQGGGHPFLTSYLIRGISRRVERGDRWDDLSPDVASRLAASFVQRQHDVLASWLQSLGQGDAPDAIWSACRLLAEAGDTGQDLNSLEDKLWELGLGIQVEEVLERLQWQGVARPTSDAPARFSVGKVFSQYFERYQRRARPEIGVGTRAAPGGRFQRLGLPLRALEYDDFVVRLSATRDGYRVYITSLEGDPSGEFRNPLSAEEQVAVWQSVAQPDRGLEEMEAIGERLFHAVFQGEILACYRGARIRVQREHLGLRLKLVLEPPELHSLPWELLYDKDLLQFLALSKNTPLVRYVGKPMPLPHFQAIDKLRVMVVAASPSDRPALNLDREIDNIRAALDPVQEKGLLEYRIVRGREANAPALLRLLRQEAYHVFHFLGHGTLDDSAGEGGLLLEGADGLGRILSARQLAQLLLDDQDIRLVYLNACQTGMASEEAPFASVAGALVQSGVPAIVATQHTISDSAASSFAAEFYQVLAEFFPVEAAVTEARRLLSLSGDSFEWGVPVLYLRAENGYVFRSAYR